LLIKIRLFPGHLSTPLHKFGVVFGEVELVTAVAGSNVGARPYRAEPGPVAKINHVNVIVFTPLST
jgi:hypothetical protein